MAENLNQLLKYNIKSFSELDELLDTKHLDITRNSEGTKEIEWKINELKERKLAIKDYKKYKNTYKNYEVAKDKNRYYQAFTSEILLYKAARRKLGNPITKEVLTSIPDIESEINNQNKQKQILMDERKGLKENIKDLKLIQNNINSYMKRDKQYQNQEIEY